MIYLLTLSLIVFVLAFGVKLLITYIFIKLFNYEKRFWEIFKPILLYELGVLSFFIIDPVSLIPFFLNPVIPYIFLFPVYFLISAIILFFIFKFIMQKFSLLDFKKSLLIFLIMFIIVTPAIYYFKGVIESKVAEVLPFSDKLSEEAQVWSYKEEMFRKDPSSKIIYWSPSEILLEKVYRLNDIFLEGEFIKSWEDILRAI